ncbi:MAG: hypothetical protein U0441_12580 [Polyangiaceae bacterium]
MSDPKPFVPPSPEVVARVRAMAERRLSAEEFDAYVNAPMSEEERTGILESAAWFCRRYPTVLERLKSARRAYADSQKRMPPDGTDDLVPPGKPPLTP